MLRKIIAYTLALIASGYALACWFFQIGIFAFLIRLQNEYIGNYFSMITGVVLVLLFWWLPLLLILGKKLIKSTEDAKLNKEDFLKTLKRPYILFSFIFLCCLAIGGAAFYWSQNTSETEELYLDLSDPISKPLFGKESLWFKKITLKGEPLVSHSYLIEESGKRGRTTLTLYTPIVNSANDQPVQFVCNLSGSTEQDVNPSRLSPTGYIIPFSLPVLVRDHFKEQGLTLADQIYIMGDSDLDEETAAYIITGIFGAFAFAFFIVLVTLPIGNKRKLKAWTAAQVDNESINKED